MIIARSTTANPPGEFLLLGLSRENVTRLMLGQPIKITAATHGDGVPAGWTIALVFGETERQLQRQLELEGLITADTELKIDPRLK